MMNDKVRAAGSAKNVLSLESIKRLSCLSMPEKKHDTLHLTWSGMAEF
jgi:hypothetical protein